MSICARKRNRTTDNLTSTGPWHLMSFQSRADWETSPAPCKISLSSVTGSLQMHQCSKQETLLCQTTCRPMHLILVFFLSLHLCQWFSEQTLNRSIHDHLLEKTKCARRGLPVRMWLCPNVSPYKCTDVKMNGQKHACTPAHVPRTHGAAG